MKTRKIIKRIIPKVKAGKKNIRKVAVVAIVALALLLYFLISGKEKDVKQTTVIRGSLSEELILSGEVNAVYHAKMSFETSGKVVYVGVSEGDLVYKGKLLTKLDTTLLNSDYQRALSDLRSAEATLTRVYDDIKGHEADESFTQKETRTTYEVAKDKAHEAVIKAKRNLDGASLIAPFSGVVTYLANPFTGVNVSLTQTQVELIDPESMYFEVLADQTEVVEISEGQKVSIILDSFEEETYTGTVETISFVPKAGEAGSIYKIKVNFEGVDLKTSAFKIGMTGDAGFILSTKDDVFYLPQEYVNNDKKGKYVKTDAKGKKLYIETGIESEEFIEIIGDIKEGLTVFD